jgi:hypothetical protein
MNKTRSKLVRGFSSPEVEKSINELDKNNINDAKINDNTPVLEIFVRSKYTDANEHPKDNRNTTLNKPLIE